MLTRNKLTIAAGLASGHRRRGAVYERCQRWYSTLRRRVQEVYSLGIFVPIVDPWGDVEGFRGSDRVRYTHA